MNGKTCLGLVEDFSYTKHSNLLHADKINNCHLNLYNQGYGFVGWHGTKKDACEKLINGDAVRPTRFDDESKKIWQGFYVFNEAERALGYCTEGECALIRAYVLLAQVRDILVASHDINEVLLLEKDIAGLRGGAGKYLISGPDVPDETGHEMVISQELLPHLVFLPSLHKVEVDKKFGVASMKEGNGEATVVDPRIDQRKNSIR